MNRTPLVAVMALAALMALWGCSSDDDPVDNGGGTDVPVTEGSCLGCHSSQEQLQLALGDTAASNFSVWDKSDG